MSIHGLPTKTPTKRMQKTVEGIKYVASAKYHYGVPVGFNLQKTVDGETVKRFRNGKGFEDQFSVKEALEWAISNL